MKTNLLAALVWLGLLSTFEFQRSTACAQDTAFTYQGRLTDNGSPANGSYDLTATLFGLASGGAPLAEPLTNSVVAVSNGLFTVRLDFGPNIFNGQPDFFLEIAVRAAAGGGFTVLRPRQLITPAPYAIFAGTAANVAGGAAVTRLNNLRDNVTLASGPNVTITPGGNTLTIGASGLNPWQTNRTNIVYNAGNVAIGTNTPAAKLHLVNGDILAGAPGAEWIFHTRSHVGSDFLQITDSDHGVFQFQHGLVLHENGNVGLGTTAPRSALEVRGDVRLGTTGDLRATSGEENLRVLRGQFSTSGVVAGSGFSVTHTAGAGRYTITFNTPYNGVPSVTVTAMDTSPTATLVPTANVVSVSSTGFGVVCHGVVNGGGTQLQDLSIQFIAAGPR